MADERDARLILRAEDRATKTFDSVTKSVKDLTKTLEAQAKAALAGEGSLSDLTSTLREIEAVGSDLEKQRSAVVAFEKIGEGAEKAAERVERTTKAYDDYKAKLDAAGATTDAQRTRLERLAGAVEKAAAAQDVQTKKLDAARDRLAALGLASENTAKQIEDIRTVFSELTPIYAAAQTAVNGYAAAQEEAAAVAAKAAASEQEAAQTVARESKAAQTAEEQRRKALLSSSAEILQGNATLTASFEELGLEQQRLAKVDALREIGAQAVAASTDLNRFAQTGETATVGLTRLAEAVRSIVAPTLSSVQSLDGAIAEVDKSAELASSKQKARVSQYQDALNSLTQAQAGLVRQAQNIDAFTRQTVVLDKLEAQLAQAAQRYEDLGRAAATATEPNDVLAKELAQAGAELERIGQQTLVARKAFATLQDGLHRAGVDTDNLTSELVRLEGAARKSAAVATVLTNKVGGGGTGFLGLKPYELQNLGYQLNDVFTSLASGISPVQTLAQQGPQISQLFFGPQGIEKAFTFLKANIIPLAAVSAAIGFIAYNISELNKQTTAIQGFTNLFALSGNAASLSAEQFGKAQIALEDLGVKANDATKALRTFIDAGLNPQGLDTFLDTVHAIAIATGEDIPTAAEKYAAALSGGYDQVVALNDITHTLNDAQLEEVQRLFDAGKAQEARTEVARIYEQRAQGISDKSKGEWASAVRDLENAFHDFSVQLHLSDIGAAAARITIALLAGTLELIAQKARDAANGLRAVVALARTAQGDPSGLPALLGDGGAPAKAPAKKSANPAGGGNSRTAGGQEYLRQQQTALKNAKLLTAQQRLQVAEQDAANAAAKAGASDAEVAQAKLNARKIEQAKLDQEAATRAKQAAAADRKAENAAARAAREAEARQNKINDLTRDLENTYDSLAGKAEDNPFAAIQAKAETAIRNIKAKFADLAKLGITKVDGKSESDFENQVRAAEALETQQATQKKNEDDLNKLLEQRKIVLGQIEDQVKSGELTPAQGLEKATEAAADLDTKIASAAKTALDFATSLRTATFDPKLEAAIAKFQAAYHEAATNQSFIAVGLDNLKEAQQQLDTLVARRDEVVKLNKALVEAGLKTPAAAQAAIKTAFNDSRPAILQSADAVQQIIDKLLQMPGISDEVKAKLEGISTGLVGVRAETKPLNEDLVALKNAAEQALSTSLNDFITSIGENVAAAISGSQSLGDTLKGIGQAALNFAAQFTKAIAQAIIQLIALKIAKEAVSKIGFLHQGGIAGSTATFTRRVSPDVFLGALRYHSGGISGLRPDEVPAILQKGEEVLTANDPRHRRNGGKGSGDAPNVAIKNINLFDPGEAVSQGANTLPGEKAILNVLSRNPTAARAALGLTR